MIADRIYPIPRLIVRHGLQQLKRYVLAKCKSCRTYLLKICYVQGWLKTSTGLDLAGSSKANSMGTERSRQGNGQSCKSSARETSGPGWNGYVAGLAELDANDFLYINFRQWCHLIWFLTVLTAWSMLNGTELLKDLVYLLQMSVGVTGFLQN